MENLFTGPTYDVEMMADFEMANPGNESASADIDREDLQRCVTGCYGEKVYFVDLFDLIVFLSLRLCCHVSVSE